MKVVPEIYLRVRLLALFLLSLAAVTSALAAFRIEVLEHPAGLLIPPLVLAAAALGGAVSFDRLSAFADRMGRARVRMTGWFYWCALVLALLAILTGQKEALLTAVDIMVFAQAALLLLAGLGRGYFGALLNTLALSCLAALAGGPAAAVAIVSHAALMLLFLCVDHPARMLSEYPVEEIPPAGPILRRAVLLSISMAAGVGGYFYMAPPQPYVLFVPDAIATADLQAALGAIYGDLAVVALVASAIFYVLLRTSFGRSGDMQALRLERVSAQRVSEPVAAPSRSHAGEDKGWRGKVVRVYCRTLEQLAALGVRRRPDQTAQELSPRLEPRTEADELTALFMRARYGPGELTEAEYREAVRASAGIVARFRSGK